VGGATFVSMVSRGVNGSEATAGAPVLRGERRRSKTRTAVLDAAEVLLARRSAEAIRIEDVATEAGISPASVYLHFGTKEALVTATMQRLLDVSMDSIMAAYTGPGTALEQAQEAGLAYMRLLLDHPALVRYLSVNTLSGPDTAIDDVVAEQVDLLRSALEERVQAAVDGGQVRPLNSRLFSYFLFGAWNGVAALMLRHGNTRLTEAEVEQCLLQARSVLVAGVAPA
jgi:AcrR family transcriptional regulator